jgi:enoyl-CoA hydratase/carnithine racemase
MNFGEPADQAKHLHLVGEKVPEAQNEAEDEARRIRRLQVMMSMVTSVISQDPGLTVEEASELAAGAKRAALAMFPDKELAYDLLYKPRLQRLMRERFRLQ